MNIKCSECGTKIKSDATSPGEIIVCSSCEAQYKVVASSDGKLCIEEFVFDGNDPGEL